MKKIALLLTICMFVLMQVVSAQTRQITGTVTAADDGAALPGVSVVVKGTTIGVITDIDGKYQIATPNDASALIFSFIGMEKIEVAIGSSNKIDVSLKRSLVNVDEVVVMGYSTSTREANTGAVSVIKNEQLADVPEVSFDKMLSGKVAGMVVTSTSGQPGSSSQIRIRGTSSLNAGNEPLYVIDGVPVMQGNQSYFTNTGNALAMINPNDIESITVLKDAAAASIYGSRAANGVILITTKSGEVGKSKVSIRGSYGVTSLANDNGYGAMNPEELVTYMRDAVVNSGMDPDNPMNGEYYVPLSLLAKPQTNWLDELTRLGSINEVEVSVSGGDEKTKHFSSALYSKTDGVFYGVDYKKLQLRSNIDHKVSDKLSFSVKFNAGQTEANDVAMQSLYYVNPIFGGIIINPWTPMFDEDGAYNLVIPENLNTNPRATAEYDDQREIQNRLITSVQAEYQPIKGLRISSTNSVEYTDGEGRRYWSAEADFNGDATLQESNLKYTQATTSNTASYQTYLNEVHSINVLAGQEATTHMYNEYYVSAPEVDPKIPFSTTSTSDNDEAQYNELEWTILSAFGIIDYNYDNKYYLKLSYRTDGSSVFGSNYRWGNFYSVGASWNMHKESFIENINFINELKLRGSYGINGNNDIGAYEQWGIYSPIQYNGMSALAPDQPANPDLTWELNTTYDIGLDFTFFERLNASFDYYYRITTDMLLNDPLSRTSGFASIRKNIGELENKGFEFLINGTVVDREVKLDLGFNIAHNQSEILDLGSEEQIIDDTGRIIHKVGESLYNFYLYDYAGVNPVNGEAIWYDEDGLITNDYAKARRILAGSPEPKFNGGFNADISWKGLSLAATFEYKIGNKVLIEENRYLNSDGYMWGSNQANTMLDYWKQPGDITRNPKPLAGNPTSSNGYVSSRWMYDGDYLRIKNITLSYSLPSKLISKANLSRVRVYGSAVNLFTFHDVDFWDPERGVTGMGFGIYPMSKSFVAGLDISF